MVRRIGLAFLIVSVHALSLASPYAYAQTANTGQNTRAVITEGIDEAKTITLSGHMRTEASPQNDRGRVSDEVPMAHLLLQLQRPPEQEKALQEFIAELDNPNSPNYHQWLTAEQFGQKFGVAKQDLDRITRWLESHGFTINVVYPSGMVVDFSGTVGQVREAFHTEIHHLEVKGERHIANMSDPQIPAALAPAVVGIVSLHDFKPQTLHTMRKSRADYSFNSGGATYALVPADLATIYNLKPLFNAGYSGQGQTIVVIEDTNVFSASDWTTFRSTLGLSSFASGSLTTVHPVPMSGTNNCSDPGIIAPNDAEAILDAEWASAAAPNAAIEMASCADTFTTFGGLIAIQNLISSSQPPDIISISYGECETQNGSAANAAYYSTYQQAASEGVSIFVAAGDSGAAGCDNGATEATHGIGVSAFASTPYNVAVGGTDFSDTYSNTNNLYWNSTNTAAYGSALSYIPEIPWNDSCAGTLVATYLNGSPTTYGANGFCNSLLGSLLLTTASGSGGPSGCATGAPGVSGVVGGTCQGWAKPSWQASLSNLGNPSDGVRDIPDVSLFAADGLWSHYYVFCWSDTANGGAACTGAPSGWSGAGGTSFAAPIMAGIQALVNQKTGARQGNPNPVYYRLAAQEYGVNGNSCNSSDGASVASTCVFYDITQGDMDVDCISKNSCYLPSGTDGVLSTSDGAYSPSYTTTTGWDFATGIGSVNAANLVNNWPASTSSAPPAPTLTSATAVSPTEIDLVWTNPASSTATANLVSRCNGTNCAPATQIATLGAGVTGYQDKSVTPSTSYTYVIEATNSGGSASSNALSATTPAIPPPAASTLISATAVSSTEIDLAWTNHANNASGVKVLQCAGSACSPSAVIATLAATATSYKNTGLIPSTIYHYLIEAYNSGGVGNSNPLSQATPALPPPSAPALTVGSAARRSLTLRWTENSPNISSFTVLRCSGTSCTPGTIITTVSGTVLTYRDASLSRHSSYRYQIRATNSSGSTLSNIAAGTTN
jgi:subtilase family serine protease